MLFGRIAQIPDESKRLGWWPTHSYFIFFRLFHSQIVTNTTWICLQMSLHKKKRPQSLVFYRTRALTSEEWREKHKLKQELIVGYFVFAKISWNFALDVFNWNYAFLGHSMAGENHVDMTANFLSANWWKCWNFRLHSGVVETVIRFVVFIYKFQFCRYAYYSWLPLFGLLTGDWLFCLSSYDNWFDVNF